MSNNINLLLNSETINSKKLARRLSTIRVMAIVFLFGVGLSSFVLFILIATSPLPSLRSDENNANTNLTRLSNQFGNYLLIENQLKSIETILANRSSYQETVRRVQSSMPSGVLLELIQVDEIGVNLRVSSQSVTDIENTILNLTELSLRNEIPASLAMTSLSSDEARGYVVEFSVKEVISLEE